VFLRELDRLRDKQDSTGLKKTQQAYRSFLTALTESQSGQTYESLQWTGESLLALDAGPEAEKVLRRVLADAIRNPAFLIHEYPRIFRVCNFLHTRSECMQALALSLSGSIQWAPPPRGLSMTRRFACSLILISGLVCGVPVKSAACFTHSRPKWGTTPFLRS